MPRALDVALAEDAVVAECGLGLAAGGVERFVQLGRRADDAHPAPASAGCGLDDQGEPDLLGLAARNDGDAGFNGDSLRLELVPAGAESLRRGPDEDQAGRLDRFREVGALRQEAVPGMDRVRAGLLRRANLLLGEQVAEHLDRLVRRAGVQRARVVRRDDRDGRDPELPAGAEDAQRDLPPVGDEQLLDGHRTPAGVRFRPARAAFSAKRIAAAGIFCARCSVCSSAEAKYSMSASVTVSDGIPLSTFMLWPAVWIRIACSEKSGTATSWLKIPGCARSIRRHVRLPPSGSWNSIAQNSPRPRTSRTTS